VVPTNTGSGYPALPAIRLLLSLAPQAAATRLLGLGNTLDLAGVSSITLPAARPASMLRRSSIKSTFN
jgi:hypothetical protein